MISKLHNYSKNNQEEDFVYFYDSTLRDGSQTSTVHFTIDDKIKIAKALDDFGIDYIEGGWPGANPIDDQFFANLPEVQQSSFVAFGMTRRKEVSAPNDSGLNQLLQNNASATCIVGKSWYYHLTNALNISEEENLLMISDSLLYLGKNGRETMFDAEHFFDGYKANKEFAMNVIRKAFNSGARWIILCDTNGGSLPHEVFNIVSEVAKEIPGSHLGIHCHNDTGNAVANSIMATLAGVRQIQGTINGIGERCGNANLISIIPILLLKMGLKSNKIDQNKLKQLPAISHLLDDILNQEPNNFAPFVGKFAFAHKGGLHVSAVAKDASCYEHINPELVGNTRQILISDQSGRANIISRLKKIGLDPDLHFKFSQISDLVNKVKDLESCGYAFDNADASFELMVKRTLGVVPNFFRIISFRVLNEKIFGKEISENITAEAIIKLEIDGKTTMCVAEGNGPVNALDLALRKALIDHYPVLKDLQLIDYKVRILGGNKDSGTKAITRVQVISSDNNASWTTIGVSENVIEASFHAILDAIIFKLLKAIDL